MTDTTQTQNQPPEPKRRAAPRRKKAKRVVSAEAPKAKANEFDGITATTCCAGCTTERCVISTVNVCKHPYKTADNGCGPVTLANREKARKLLKRQKIEAAA